jgi:transcriptional regulator with GAF, ATPase, and Fis domain
MEKKILIVEDEFVVANDLATILTRSGYTVCGIADTFAEALFMIDRYQPTLVLLDIYLKGDQTGIDLAHQLAERNIAFVYLSANNNESVLQMARATQPYGFLVKPFRERDVLVALDIAHYRHAHSMEARLRKEQSIQLALTNIMVDTISWEERLLKVAATLQQAVPFDFAVLGIKRTGEDQMGACAFFRVGFDEYQTIRIPDLCTMIGATPPEFGRMSDEVIDGGPGIFNSEDFNRLCASQPVKHRLARMYQLQSNLVMPLKITREGIFVFSFHSRRADAYTTDHLNLLLRLQPSIAVTIDRLLAFDEIRRLSEQLKREMNYLREEVKSNANFEEIIGSSHTILHALDQVTQVAPLGTSVLLLGESGTGKELIARAIHGLSPRREKLLVKVNCAALPANLIESELFGHEKGAFTGALDKRIGKFELAHGGTIFLDEIGEMPIDMQTRLLRVLQEKEIERIGGRQTIPIDVRVIAATNRDLESEVAKGNFRLDLYYRLNVFPITLPALRDRREDIPLLASHFAHKFSKKTGRPFLGIKPAALEELTGYNWPGNIRELENVIEQAFVLNDGKSQLQWGRPLNNPTGTSIPATPVSQATSLEHIKEMQHVNERTYILSVLQKTNGRIRGAGGAAEILKLKPTTLESRIEKLGIRKTSNDNSE